MHTGLIDVFVHKLETIKKKIKKILSLPKKDRNKAHLKKLLKETKSLKKILKKGCIHDNVTCPNCGTIFKV